MVAGISSHVPIYVTILLMLAAVYAGAGIADWTEQWIMYHLQEPENHDTDR